jgi:hypothetical protein
MEPLTTGLNQNSNLLLPKYKRSFIFIHYCSSWFRLIEIISTIAQKIQKRKFEPVVDLNS